MGGCVTTNFLCSCWGRNSQGLSCGSTTYLCCGGGMTHKCVSYIWTTRCKDIRITRNKNEMGTLEGIQRKVWHSVSVLLHSSFRLLRHFFKKRCGWLAIFPSHSFHICFFHMCHLLPWQPTAQRPIHLKCQPLHIAAKERASVCAHNVAGDL